MNCSKDWNLLDSLEKCYCKTWCLCSFLLNGIFQNKYLILKNDKMIGVLRGNKHILFNSNCYNHQQTTNWTNVLYQRDFHENLYFYWCKQSLNQSTVAQMVERQTRIPDLSIARSWVPILPSLDPMRHVSKHNMYRWLLSDNE